MTSQVKCWISDLWITILCWNSYAGIGDLHGRPAFAGVKLLERSLFGIGKSFNFFWLTHWLEQLWMITKKAKKHLIFELNRIDLENKVTGEYAAKGMIEIRRLLGENSWKRTLAFAARHKASNQALPQRHCQQELKILATNKIRKDDGNHYKFKSHHSLPETDLGTCALGEKRLRFQVALLNWSGMLDE